MIRTSLIEHGRKNGAENYLGSSISNWHLDMSLASHLHQIEPAKEEMDQELEKILERDHGLIVTNKLVNIASKHPEMDICLPVQGLSLNGSQASEPPETTQITK